MVKLLLGAMALVGVLGFVACNSNPQPGPTLADCPANITVVSGASGFAYSVPSCQLKVGSSVTIEASGSHPLIARGSTPLVSSTQNSNFTYTALSADVGKSLEFQCQIHGPSMSGLIKVVAAM
jgi:plastocyanin